MNFSKSLSSSLCFSMFTLFYLFFDCLCAYPLTSTLFGSSFTIFQRLLKILAIMAMIANHSAHRKIQLRSLGFWIECSVTIFSTIIVSVMQVASKVIVSYDLITFAMTSVLVRTIVSWTFKTVVSRRVVPCTRMVSCTIVVRSCRIEGSFFIARLRCQLLPQDVSNTSRIRYLICFVLVSQSPPWGSRT